MIRCLNCSYENPDEATVCAHCGFTLNWEPEPTPKPKPELPAEIVLTLSPSPARVKAGERVTLRMSEPFPPELAAADWVPTGAAAEMATALAGAGLDIDVPTTATPGTRDIVLLATGEGIPPARAVGRLEVLAPERVEVTPPHDGPSALVVALAGIAGVLVLLVVIGVIARLAAPKTDVTILAARGVCLHTSPDTDASSRIPLPEGGCEGPNQGEVVQVRCVENGVFRLSGGDRWITTHSRFVQAEREIGACPELPLSLLLGDATVGAAHVWASATALTEVAPCRTCRRSSTATSRPR